MKKRCLLIVDLQNDFCPGGALPVKDGDKIVEPINRIMDKFDLIIASKDMHPEKTVHFDKWPVHCVRGTRGSEFHPDLNSEKIDFVFEKGTGNKDDGYSAFDATNKDLEEFLRENKVDELYVCGLATDYCVKATVLDALKRGFKTLVLTDCIKAVNVNPDDGEKALKEMRDKGAILIESKEI